MICDLYIIFSNTCKLPQVHEICSVDPCHKFTWCLDACIRERFIDSKRAKELQGFLDNVRRGREQVLGSVYCNLYFNWSKLFHAFLHILTLFVSPSVCLIHRCTSFEIQRDYITVRIVTFLSNFRSLTSTNSIAEILER